MIKFSHRGSFANLEKLLKKSLGRDYKDILDQYGQIGVTALSAATPKDTGTTASSWKYDIIEKKNELSIIWSNENIVDGANIAILLQYGHGTRNGGYVNGIDYVNPALKPVFDRLADAAWKEVIQK